MTRARLIVCSWKRASGWFSQCTCCRSFLGLPIKCLLVMFSRCYRRSHLFLRDLPNSVTLSYPELEALKVQFYVYGWQWDGKYPRSHQHLPLNDYLVTHECELCQLNMVAWLPATFSTTRSFFQALHLSVKGNHGIQHLVLAWNNYFGENFAVTQQEVVYVFLKICSRHAPTVKKYSDIRLVVNSSQRK